MSKTRPEPASDETIEDCFILMPIGDTDSHPPGHFKRVYLDLIRPACASSGYNPIRADDSKQANLIHLDILSRIVSAPMAVCDLSTRNPNVLFELGIRQAFDLPVVLIQEVGTPKIFDISPLRYVEYRKDLKYHEVLEDQTNLSIAIDQTKNSIGKGESVNSIVKLLALTKAAKLEAVPQADIDPQMELVRSEIAILRNEIRSLLVLNSSSDSGLNSQVAARLSGMPDLKASRELEDVYNSFFAAQSFYNDTGAKVAQLHSSQRKLLRLIERLENLQSISSGSIAMYMTILKEHIISELKGLDERIAGLVNERAGTT